MTLTGEQATREQWDTFRSALNEDDRIGVLKAFRDRLICDGAFNRAFNIDPEITLESEYSILSVSDVSIFIPQQLQEKLGWDGEKSDRAELLKKTLDLDRLQRERIKQLQLVHAGWDVWRQKQITRYQNEDRSPRGVQITHIPFAIELTRGCSGACSFCGLSAPQLSDKGSDARDLGAAFERLLKELHKHSGALGEYGVLYWASDPLDHRQYETYAELFAKEFGVWPGTTTALAETQLERVKRIIHSDAMERPWGLRCSMRSASAYRQLCQGLTVNERALLRLLPQYRQSGSVQALAGRAYQPDASDRQLEAGGSIACMSGLLISLPQNEISLITPCRAEPLNRNGYRTLASTQAATSDELADAAKRILINLPCPVISPGQLLRVNIDRSQYSLYCSQEFPDLLSRLEEQPMSLVELCRQLSPASSPQELIGYCVTLLQVGAVRSV